MEGTRPEGGGKKGYVTGTLNLQQGGKFETWLGSLIGPQEPCYLLAADEASREDLIRKAATIGNKSLIKGALIGTPAPEATMPQLDVDAFRDQPGQYTIVDVRNATEPRDEPLFADSRNLPLLERWERVREISTDKPVVVHCAGGYRSAAGASIVAAALPGTEVLDLSEAVKSLLSDLATH